MSDDQVSPAEGDLAVPAACTLPTAEQPLRRSEIETLLGTAVRQVQRLGPGHVRLSLAGGPGLVAAVRDLTAREAACCSFFDFAVALAESEAPDDEAANLDIRVPPGYVPVLDAIAGAAARAADQWAGRAA